jgi:hypothetical protein
MQSLASKQQEYLTMKAIYLSLALIPSIAFATPPHNPPSNNDDISSSSDANALGLGVGVGVGIGEGGDATAIGKGGNAHSNATAVGLGGNAHGGNAVSGSHSGASSGSLSSAHQVQGTNVETGDVRNTNTLGNDSRNTNANELTNASTASNDGNSLSTSYQNDTTALALGLGSTTAAPVDSSTCRKGQTAGWRVAVIERTGRNKYNEECLAAVLDEELRAADFARCMDLANAYLKVRLEQAYALQLEKCGGALERALISSSLASREPITQVGTPEYATKEELNRAFSAAQSK